MASNNLYLFIISFKDFYFFYGFKWSIFIIFYIFVQESWRIECAQGGVFGDESQGDLWQRSKSDGSVLQGQD